MAFTNWMGDMQGGLGDPYSLVVKIIFIGLVISFLVLFAEKLLKWMAVKLLKL